MKKNLFLISESEKNRILNMHRNAISSQYLGEQAQQPASGEQPAAQLPTEIKSVADIQNFLLSKGFDIGKTGADGKMGPSTIAALGKFMSGGAGSTTPTQDSISKGLGATGTSGAAGTTTGVSKTPQAAQAAAVSSSNPGMAAAQTQPTTATPANPATATPANPATATPAQPTTTNVPLASRQDIRQQNRQLRQDQRTLNRLGGKMTPQQQQAYQQSIAARTGIGTK